MTHSVAGSSRGLVLVSLLGVAVLAVPSAARAQSEVCRMSLDPPAFEAPSEDGLHALPHGASSGHNAFHGQALYGVENLHLSHLPVFMGEPAAHPHNFQVILAVNLNDPVTQAEYSAERSRQPMSLYTATPVPFDQIALVAGYPGRPALDALPAGSIVEGHFEQGGQPIIEEVTFDIDRVVYFREFYLGGAPLEEQNYVLFGRGGEVFAAHLLSAPPDFDQMLAVDVEVTGSQAAELAAEIAAALAGGIYLQLPERANGEDTRLLPGSELACSLSLPSSEQPIEVAVTAVDEIYCEAGEFSELVTSAFNAPRRCGGP